MYAWGRTKACHSIAPDASGWVRSLPRLRSAVCTADRAKYPRGTGKLTEYVAEEYPQVLGSMMRPHSEAAQLAERRSGLQSNSSPRSMVSPVAIVLVRFDFHRPSLAIHHLWAHLPNAPSLPTEARPATAGSLGLPSMSIRPPIPYKQSRHFNLPAFYRLCT